MSQMRPSKPFPACEAVLESGHHAGGFGGKLSFGGAGWNILDDRAVILLDHHARLGEQRRRHGETERIRGLEIDRQLELGRDLGR